MKFKLSLSQIEGIHLFMVTALTKESTNVLMLLLNELNENLAEKVRKKCIKIRREGKPHTSITLNPIEAKALYVWFQTLRKENELPDLYYEITVMQMLVDYINQEYA